MQNRFLCKKEFYYKECPVYEKNKYYYVYVPWLDYHKNEIFIETPNVVKSYGYSISGYWFLLDENITTGLQAHKYIWDYFYTDKEVRKLKLQKLEYGNT